MEHQAILAALREKKLDTVPGAFSYCEGEDLNKEGLGGRRRTRFELRDKDGYAWVFYLKRYLGPAKFHWPRYWGKRSPAQVEFENIEAVRAIGLPTMQPIIWGEDRNGPQRRSYLIVTAVPGDSLERCFERFLSDRGNEVSEVTRSLARLVRILHGSGYVHRDLYSSHIFLDTSGRGPQLYLIDLARMFAPHWRKFRWYVKDLAQMKYSMPPAWVNGYWDLFLAEYLGRNLKKFNRFARAVRRKVALIQWQVKRRKRHL